ncbi:MAG TPA: YkvA family protein [Pseudomonadales bacterium]|nr:YkvA family protein [Pseudomonadales bacterium]
MSPPERTDKSDPPPLGFERFRRRAAEMVEDREALRKLGAQALERARVRSPALGAAVDDLLTLVRLLQAWVRADYREISKSTLVLVVAAVLYFVVPFDLIPDFLGGLGFVDDIAVVGWVMRHMRKELQDFRYWETRSDAMETIVGRSQVPHVDPDRPGE